MPDNGVLGLEWVNIYGHGSDYGLKADSGWFLDWFMIEAFSDLAPQPAALLSTSLPFLNPGQTWKFQ